MNIWKKHEIYENKNSKILKCREKVDQLGASGPEAQYNSEPVSPLGFLLASYPWLGAKDN